ncbi:hypothetical protein [Roseimaritima multifibrata]|uniref:hypothetical protein n=1 Tax=Roseimaritima multifibrata TaxID=1930274 RepID=UPI0011A3B621|nr:hypothetical protein [Roseimaritima multifibrata]
MSNGKLEMQNGLRVSSFAFCNFPLLNTHSSAGQFLGGQLRRCLLGHAPWRVFTRPRQGSDRFAVPLGD